VGGETWVLLREVIFRIELPDLAEIPDASAVTQADEEDDPLTRWRIPGTEITIARVEEGSRIGEYLFSPDTVDRAREFYDLVRELPYQRPAPEGSLVRAARLFTGWMIPPAWIEALPDWTNTTLFGQTLWKWFVLLLLLGSSLGLMIFVYRWGQRGTRERGLSTYMRLISAPAAILVIAPVLQYLFRSQLNVTGSAAQIPDYIIQVVGGVAIIWLLWVTANWIAEAVIASPRINPQSLDANLLRLAARSVGSVAALVLIMQVLHDIGVPAYGLVAGAGVGGIAIALAAKSTLENVMGALNLFADRPVRVGDLCRYDEDHGQGWRPVGRVESIGLRSTKIRKLDRTLVTIPNGEFAQLRIVNFGKCDRMLLATILAIRYETTDDQLRFLLTRLRELLYAHPMVVHTADDPVRVRFVGYGDISLNVEVRAYVRTSDYNDFLAIQEDILLRSMQIVKEAGTGFAFPSRTLYLGRDGGIDHERQQAAEKQVREWASAQNLPFPDFPEDYRTQISGTLDYPPEGSPKADRG
jgi:MscS family membrane protein